MVASTSSRPQYRSCSICQQRQANPVSHVSLRNRYTSWHRAYNLCSSCTRLWSAFFDELQKRARA